MRTKIIPTLSALQDCRSRSSIGLLLLLLLLLLLGLLYGCSGTGNKEPVPSAIPDAVPRVEPRSKYGNPKSYVVWGKRYYTKTSSKDHVERGVASWYGKKFHGRRTSNRERYDMYAMTAAHKSLPLPTYARVTNLTNGRSAVVRINDRGPFHGNRIIDLSYSAARKLGMVAKGTAMVEVRTIDSSHPESDRQDGFLAATNTTHRVRTEARKRAVDTKTPALKKPAPRTGKAVTRVAKAKQLSAPDRAEDPAEFGAPRPKVAGSTTAEKARQATRSALYLQVGAFGSRVNAEYLRRRLLNHTTERVRVRLLSDDKTPRYKVQVGPLDSRKSASDLSRQLASLGLEGPHIVVE